MFERLDLQTEGFNFLDSSANYKETFKKVRPEGASTFREAYATGIGHIVQFLSMYKKKELSK